jgi:hypothetical protein
MRISRLGSSRNIARGAYRVTRFAWDAENQLPVMRPVFHSSVGVARANRDLKVAAVSASHEKQVPHRGPHKTRLCSG